MKRCSVMTSKISAFLIVLSFASCSSKPSDGEIRAMVSLKAKEEMNFAGVNYSVSKGVVTLTGSCPSEKGRTTVEQEVSKIFGVKEVINETNIAPVVLDTDFPLKQAVDSILMKTAAIEGVVEDSIIYLRGVAKNSELKEINSKLNNLQPKMIRSQLAIN